MSLNPQEAEALGSSTRLGEKGFNLRFAHCAWMSHVVKVDISHDPGNVALFGPERVMLQLDIAANLIQESGFLLFHRASLISTRYVDKI